MPFMKSYFNPTIVRKSFWRCWPIWAFYSVVLFFTMPAQVIFARDYYGSYLNGDVHFMQSVVNDLPHLFPFIFVFLFFIALGLTMQCFGYLYKSSSTILMHSLPVSRKTLFWSNFMAGFLSAVIPTTVISVFTVLFALLRGATGFSPILILWGIMCLSFLFFYAFAILCAQITGNILALPALFAIFNFVVWVLTYLFSSLLPTFLYGYNGYRSIFTQMGDHSIVDWLTPTVHILDNVYWTHNYMPMPEGFVGTQPITSYYLNNGWILGVYSIVALAFLALAYFIYKYRHVESAGDPISIRALFPLFRISVSFCTGICMGMLSSELIGFGNSALPLSILCVIWAVIGYLIAEMILQKSFRVRHAWRGAAIMALAMVLCFTALWTDVIGYSKKVPDGANVESISLNLSLYHGANGNYMNNTNFDNITNEQLISTIIQTHQLITQAPRAEECWNETTSFRIVYTMKNGTTLARSFPVAVQEGQRGYSAPAVTSLEALLAMPDLIEHRFQKFFSLETSQITEVFIHTWDENMTYSHIEEKYFLPEETLDQHTAQAAADRDVSSDMLPLTQEEISALYTALCTDLRARNIERFYLTHEQAENDGFSGYTVEVTWEVPQKQPNGDTYLRSMYEEFAITDHATNTMLVLEQLNQK